MWWTPYKIAAVLLLALTTLGTGTVLLCRPGAEAQEAQRPSPAPQGAKAAPEIQVAVFALVQLEPPQENAERFLDMQRVLVKSMLVLQGALQRPEVARQKLLANEEDPVRWLGENLVVDYPNGAAVLRIGLPGKPRQELADLVNAVTDTYLEKVVAKDRLADRVRQLQEIAEQYQKQVENRRRQLQDLMRAVGAETTPQFMEQHLQQQLGDCSREHRRIKLAAVAARVRLERLKAEQPVRRSEVARLEEELEILDAQEKVLRQEDKELLARAGQVQMADLRLQEVRSELAQAERLLMKVQAEVQEAARVMAAPRSRLVQKAEVGKPK
jgi:hypothetical protein